MATMPPQPPPPQPGQDPRDYARQQKDYYRAWKDQQKDQWRANRDQWKVQRDQWRAQQGYWYGRRRSIVGPIVLVAIGVIFLLIHTGHMEGFRVWATHSFPLFEAVFEEPETAASRVVEVSQLLAVRIRDFGGVLHNLVPGATLHNEGLRLVAFKTRSRMQYSRFLVAVMFSRQTFTGQIELLDAASVVCRPRNGSLTRIFAEADGELLGHLPVSIEIVPQAVNLLIPANARP